MKDVIIMIHGQRYRTVLAVVVRLLDIRRWQMIIMGNIILMHQKDEDMHKYIITVFVTCN